MAAEGEEGVVTGLQRRHPQLFPPHRGRAGPLLVDDVGHDWAPPLGERGVEECQGLIAWAEAAGLGNPILEARHVERVAVDGEEVARPFPPERVGVAECSAQERDVALQRVDGRRRRPARPYVVDQAVDGDDVAGHQRQPCQDSPLARPAERHRLSAELGRDGSEQADVQDTRLVPGSSLPPHCP